MSIEKLPGDYNRGYTQAIQDLSEIVKDMFEFDRRVRPTKDTLRRVVKCWLENRDKAREHIGFMRWRVDPNSPPSKWKAEWYTGGNHDSINGG